MPSFASSSSWPARELLRVLHCWSWAGLSPSALSLLFPPALPLLTGIIVLLHSFLLPSRRVIAISPTISSTTSSCSSTGRHGFTWGQPVGQWSLNQAAVTKDSSTWTDLPQELTYVLSSTQSPKLDFPKSCPRELCGFRVSMLGSFSLSTFIWWFGLGSFSLSHPFSVGGFPKPGSFSLGGLSFLLRQQRWDFHFCTTWQIAWPTATSPSLRIWCWVSDSIRLPFFKLYSYGQTLQSPLPADPDLLQGLHVLRLVQVAKPCKRSEPWPSSSHCDRLRQEIRSKFHTSHVLHLPYTSCCTASCSALDRRRRCLDLHGPFGLRITWIPDWESPYKTRVPWSANLPSSKRSTKTATESPRLIAST